MIDYDGLRWWQMDPEGYVWIRLGLMLGDGPRCGMIVTDGHRWFIMGKNGHG